MQPHGTGATRVQPLCSVVPGREGAWAAVLWALGRTGMDRRGEQREASMHQTAASLP